MCACERRCLHCQEPNDKTPISPDKTLQLACMTGKINQGPRLDYRVESSSSWPVVPPPERPGWTQQAPRSPRRTVPPLPAAAGAAAAAVISAASSGLAGPHPSSRRTPPLPLPMNSMPSPPNLRRHTNSGLFLDWQCSFFFPLR